MRGARSDEIEFASARSTRSSILVTSIQSLLQPVPGRDALAAATREIRVGGALDEQEFTRWLVERGGHATTAVELPGEFSLRGGILDSFRPMRTTRCGSSCSATTSSRSAGSTSRRSGASERSTRSTSRCSTPTASDRAHFTGYLPPETLVPARRADRARGRGQVLSRAAGAAAGVSRACGRRSSEIYKFPSVTAAGVPPGSMETTCHLQFESVERFSGDIAKVRDELDTVERRARGVHRLRDRGRGRAAGRGVRRHRSCSRDGRLHFVVGHLEAGFRLVPQSGRAGRAAASCFSGRIWRGRRGGG